MLPRRDAELVQIVDAALADATARARKSDGTSWLACRPGCTPCCHGVFKISMLDAERLRSALAELQLRAPERARAIQARATEFTQALAARFPGDASTGLLHDDENAWDEFADLPQADLPCPALAPATGNCELYSGRPLTCRVFGPPVLGDDGIGVCELCYVGADTQDILHGQMFLTHSSLEQQLDNELSADETVIAWALRPGP